MADSMAARLIPGSLEKRLIAVMLLLAMLPAAAVGWIAYRGMSEHVGSARTEASAPVADSKQSQLGMLLRRENERAKSFLSGLIAQCDGAVSDPGCAGGLLKSYLEAEKAIGVTLRRQGDGKELTVGVPAAQNGAGAAFQAGRVAQFSGAGAEDNFSYFISTEDSAGFRLLVTYPSPALEPVFDSSSAAHDEESSAPLTWPGQRMIASMSALGLALFVLAVYAARVAVRPVKKLTEAARAIAAGDFTAIAGIKGKGEIAELAAAFDLMVSRLREQAAALEGEARECGKRLLQAQQEAAALRQRNETLEEFTCMAAHDLKEPLRGIHNYAGFLREDCGGRLDDGARQHIASIQRLAERLSGLIDRLLACSRPGCRELAQEPVDVDAVVDAIAEDLAHLWRASAHGGMEIELRRKSPLGTVRGDATRIGEVFQNLISNAAKYNDKPLRWVEIGCDRSGSTPVFHVRDNGIGIMAHHQEDVFGLFKRLHGENRYGGGTGVGLAIARKIIALHGGRIWLESTVGVGTIFRFTLGENA